MRLSTFCGLHRDTEQHLPPGERVAYRPVSPVSCQGEGTKVTRKKEEKMCFKVKEERRLREIEVQKRAKYIHRHGKIGV
jgi:hypothetical protein